MPDSENTKVLPYDLSVSHMEACVPGELCAICVLCNVFSSITHDGSEKTGRFTSFNFLVQKETECGK